MEPITEIAPVIAAGSEIVQTWTAVGTLAGSIAVVNLLTNITKRQLFAKFIKPGYRPFIALVLGTLSSSLAGIASGMNPVMAFVTGLGAGAAAIGVNEVWHNTAGKARIERKAMKAVKDVIAAGDEKAKEKADDLHRAIIAAIQVSDKKKRLEILAALGNKR